MARIEIRPLKRNEIKQAVRIWLEASIKAHHFIDPGFWESMVSEMESTWLPVAENLGILKNDRLIGFCSLTNNRLAAIFINPVEQGNGYGKLLLNDVKKRRTRLDLTVYEKNRTSIEFYKKNGFQAVDKQKDIMTGEDEIVMFWGS